jgi:transposase
VSTRNRRKFTPEFKAEAVEMVEAAGGNIARVAKELGIYDSTLGNWVRDARQRAQGAPTSEERQEIRELRRELERTRRERDILAKAGMCAAGTHRWRMKSWVGRS